MAVIKVGAGTRAEMKEKKAGVEDALHATRAAVEQGIVPGGGVALVRAAAALDALNFSDDRQYGVEIIRRAIGEPLRQIAQNAGEDGSIVVDKVRNGTGSFGFNAASEKYEDLVAAGVIDPAKVVRSALQNAASVSRLMLTSEALIAEKPKKDKPAAGGGAGAGGMGGMGGDDFYSTRVDRRLCRSGGLGNRVPVLLACVEDRRHHGWCMKVAADAAGFDGQTRPGPDSAS